MTHPKKPSPSREPTVTAHVTAHVVGADPLVVAPPAAANIAAALVTFTAQRANYDPQVAADLVIALHPRLSTISPKLLDFPRVDVEAVARAMLDVCSLTHFPPVLALYKAEAAQGQLKLANLDDLRDLALVLLHAFRLADVAGAFRTTKVSADLDAQSAEVEARIQKQCEHFFMNDATLGPLLIQLRAGTGFLDRAYDLFGYADIYEQKHATVSLDPVFYRATDLADARRLGAQILSEIDASMNQAAREAFDLLKRAWTLLKAVYFEVQQAGLWLLRYDPQREERFPSLYAVGRKGQGRKKAAAAEPSAAEPSAAEPTAKAGTTADKPAGK
jgi:hypothetical protein